MWFLVSRVNVIVNMWAKLGHLRVNERERGESRSRSRLGEDMWEAQHKVLWDEVIVIYKEKKWLESRFTKAAFITTNKDVYKRQNYMS